MNFSLHRALTMFAEDVAWLGFTALVVAAASLPIAAGMTWLVSHLGWLAIIFLAPALYTFVLTLILCLGATRCLLGVIFGASARLQPGVGRFVWGDRRFHAYLINVFPEAVVLMLPGLRAFINATSMYRLLYYRLMGCGIGWTSQLAFTTQMYDLALLEIGEGAKLGSDVLVSAHLMKGERMYFAPVIIAEGANVGARSSIGPGVKLGTRASIGYGCCVGPRNTIGSFAGIGACSMLASDVHVGLGAKVGHGCRLGSHVRLGAKARVANLCTLNSGVRMGDHARVGSSSNVGERSTIGARARIGAGCRIASGVRVGEASLLGDGCILHRGARLHASVVLGAGVIIGAHAEIEEGARIPDGTIVEPSVRVPRQVVGSSNRAQAGGFKPVPMEPGQRAADHMCCRISG